jgi:FKBP-type peptidyl-prolyl cis-trans isomerase 2
MAETVKKNDFISLEFTGKIKETNETFDTNIAEELKKTKANVEARPYIISVGNSMTLKGLDEVLVDKEVGKEYAADFTPEQAFGKRNPSMVRIIPIKSFLEQRIKPEKGMQLSLNGSLVKVVSVSGGRVLVDFNNPLAGKVVSYKFKIIKKVDDQRERVEALQDFFFKRKFDFEIKDKQVVFKVEKNVEKFVQVMAKPFQELLGLQIKTEIIENKQEVKK